MRANVDQRQMGHHCLGNRPRPDADGADPKAKQQRAEQKRERRQRPAGGDPTRPHLRRLLRGCLGHYDRLAACATTRAKATIRGPQREAMSSLTPITRPCLTAERFCQPAPAAVVVADGLQHLVSERTTRSGLALRMYSADNFG